MLCHVWFFSCHAVRGSWEASESSPKEKKGTFWWNSGKLQPFLCRPETQVCGGAKYCGKFRRKRSSPVTLLWGGGVCKCTFRKLELTFQLFHSHSHMHAHTHALQPLWCLKRCKSERNLTNQTVSRTASGWFAMLTLSQVMSADILCVLKAGIKPVTWSLAIVQKHFANNNT